ncbi:MAG: hypothetical protein RBR35_19850 [Salinivirgaceae bacterium]|nr:hypothetical protein [Salinivirgaceae bacterium]
MSKERENEIEGLLQDYRKQEVPMLISELLNLRRERHRDSIERTENTEVRGRSKECKDLLQIFS